MDEQIKVKMLRVSPRHHRAIEVMAESSQPRTTLQGMLEFIIDQEIERRGIDPKTLDQQAESSAA